MDFNEAKDDAVTGWQWQIGQTICKQSAPYYRQTTTPTPHHLIFMGQMLFSTKMCSASFKKTLKLFSGLPQSLFIYHISRKPTHNFLTHSVNKQKNNWQ